MATLRRLGLTGGIGSGKSTVAAMLVEAGAHLVDTDAIARRLTGPGGAAMPALGETFGPQALARDGSLDRPFMRQRAFSDPAARRRLEAILHPLIGEQAQREAATAGDRLVVFDVPLLAESAHWRGRVDAVLVVDCPVETQIERVAGRPGWTREAAASVVAQQATRERRRAVADAVIFNHGLSMEALRQEVGSLWALWNNRPLHP